MTTSAKIRERCCPMQRLAAFPVDRPLLQFGPFKAALNASLV
ncbi:hypothetical protein [Comamonas sp. NLF-1-9]|nr:hypothetical protein [Comamonas sp. NLF-1-9]